MASGVGIEVGVSVGPGVEVGIVGVALGISVAVGLAVGVSVAVALGVSVFVGVEVGVAEGEGVGLGVHVGSTPYSRKVVSMKAHPNNRQQHKAIPVIGIARSMNFCFPVIEFFIVSCFFPAGAAA